MAFFKPLFSLDFVVLQTIWTISNFKVFSCTDHIKKCHGMGIYLSNLNSTVSGDIVLLLTGRSKNMLS